MIAYGYYDFTVFRNRILKDKGNWPIELQNLLREYLADDCGGEEEFLDDFESDGHVGVLAFMKDLFLYKTGLDVGVDSLTWSIFISAESTDEVKETFEKKFKKVFGPYLKLGECKKATYFCLHDGKMLF